MKFIRGFTLFLIVCFLFALLIGVRLGSFQIGESINAVAVIEIAVVLIVSSLCFCSILARSKKKVKNHKTMRETKARLRILLQEMDGNDVQQISIQMQERLLIGCNLHITHIAFPNDSTISPLHCRLIYDEEIMYLEDLHSKNGTYLNGIRIIEKTEIHQGDVLTIGKESFRLKWFIDQVK